VLKKVGETRTWRGIEPIARKQEALIHRSRTRETMEPRLRLTLKTKRHAQLVDRMPAGEGSARQARGNQGEATQALLDDEDSVLLFLEPNREVSQLFAYE